MSKVYMIGDLHFGHKNIGTFRPGIGSEEENRAALKAIWNSVVRKNDLVYVLGDAAFTMEGLSTYAEMAGNKILVHGNHDKLDTGAYLKHFKQVRGAIKYKGHWLTHIPIHPMELRGCKNIHGHCHAHGIDHPDYFNVCVDWLPGMAPMLFTDIKEALEKR